MKWVNGRECSNTLSSGKVSEANSSLSKHMKTPLWVFIFRPPPNSQISTLGLPRWTEEAQTRPMAIRGGARLTHSQMPNQRPWVLMLDWLRYCALGWRHRAPTIIFNAYTFARKKFCAKRTEQFSSYGRFLCPEFDTASALITSKVEHKCRFRNPASIWFHLSGSICNAYVSHTV